MTVLWWARYVFLVALVLGAAGFAAFHLIHDDEIQVRRR